MSSYPKCILPAFLVPPSTPPSAPSPPTWNELAAFRETALRHFTRPEDLAGLRRVGELLTESALEQAHLWPPILGSETGSGALAAYHDLHHTLTFLRRLGEAVLAVWIEIDERARSTSRGELSHDPMGWVSAEPAGHSPKASEVGAPMRNPPRILLRTLERAEASCKGLARIDGLFELSAARTLAAAAQVRGASLLVVGDVGGQALPAGAQIRAQRGRGFGERLRVCARREDAALAHWLDRALRSAPPHLVRHEPLPASAPLVFGLAARGPPI
jgi:hypothetical protein